MNKAIKELICCLSKEKKIYEQYFSLTDKKIEAIKKADMDMFSAVFSEEKDILDKILLIEGDRSKIISKLSDKENVTISEISKMTNDVKLKNELDAVVDDFQELIHNLKEKNKICSILLQHNINYINYIINSIVTGEGTYGYGGKDENTKQKLNIFDKKV